METRARLRDLIGQYFELAGRQAEVVLDEFTRESVQGGQWLFHQGDPGDSLYILARGRLQVWIDPDSGEETGPAFLGEVAPGETVGEISLLTGQPRTASIRAARDSLLLKVDRAGFERLATNHPQMAIRLAGSIAARLQRRTSGRQAPARRLVNICLIPLDDGDSGQRFGRELARALDTFGPTLDLEPGRLSGLGAPVNGLEAGGAIPPALPVWLDEQEDRSRFVIYRAQPADTPWTRLAVRQADIVVLVGDSGSDPGARSWERTVLGSRGERLVRHVLVLVHPDDGSEIRGTRHWLESRDVDFHLHARSGGRGDVDRVARVLAGRALGLVLGAGAARGFAHIGVYRAMVEAGIEIDWVGGSSIGAILGCGLARKWSPDRLSEAAYDGLVSSRPFSDYTVPVVSLLGGLRMMKAVRRLLPGRIEDLPIPFFCLSSNLDGGTVNVHEFGPVDRAIQASAALPGALPPAVVDRHLAVDGAVLNSLPVDVMRQRPVGEVVAVNLSSSRTYEVDYDELPPAWTLARGRWLGMGKRYRVPGLITLLLKSTEIGTLARVKEQSALADLVLNPDVRRFGMTQVKAFHQIVEAGYQEACERLPAWLEERAATD